LTPRDPQSSDYLPESELSEYETTTTAESALTLTGHVCKEIRNTRRLRRVTGSDMLNFGKFFAHDRSPDCAPKFKASGKFH